MKIITRVVEHPIIDTNPHLGMSLALLFTCTSDLLNLVLMFILFQAVNQHESEILADHLVCDISGTNFCQIRSILDLDHFVQMLLPWLISFRLFHKPTPSLHHHSTWVPVCQQEVSLPQPDQVHPTSLVLSA